MGYYHLPAGFFMNLSSDQVAQELLDLVRPLPRGAGPADDACNVGLG